MKKQPKNIRRICMVSSAAFSAASGIYGWAASIGAALGLAVNMTESEKRDNQIEFEEAVDRALEKTKEAMYSDSKKEILKELCQLEIEIDSLTEIIKNTETYRMQYCTEADAKEIVEIFEMYFREEIAQRDTLSNLYILSTGLMTLEKLKKINDILYANEEKLDMINGEVSKIAKTIDDAKNICIKCFNSIAFILVGMAVFLGIGIFAYPSCDRDLVFIVPICYGITDFLTWFLTMEQSITKSIQEVAAEKWHLNISRKIKMSITIFLVPMLMTISCFWIILLVTDIGRDIKILGPTIGVLLGNFVSIGLKSLMNKKYIIEKFY